MCIGLRVAIMDLKLPFSNLHLLFNQHSLSQGASSRLIPFRWSFALPSSLRNATKNLYVDDAGIFRVMMGQAIDGTG